MTEFIGLDLEMELNAHYSEVIDMLDSMLLHIFRGLQSQYHDEVCNIDTNFERKGLNSRVLRVRVDED